MSAPKKTYKKGKIQLAIWEGNFEGKPTISFSIKKTSYDKTTNSWKDSSYYSITDLQDIQSLCNVVVLRSIENASEGKQSSQSVQKQQPVEEQPNDNDCPWR